MLKTSIDISHADWKSIRKQQPKLKLDGSVLVDLTKIPEYYPEAMKIDINIRQIAENTVKVQVVAFDNSNMVMDIVDGAITTDQIHQRLPILKPDQELGIDFRTHRFQYMAFAPSNDSTNGFRQRGGRYERS